MILSLMVASLLTAALIVSSEMFSPILPMYAFAAAAAYSGFG